MKKILIIDDEEGYLNILSMSLNGLGNYDYAGDGSTAIEYVDSAIQANNPYEVVLLDLGLPGMNGIEVLEKIRQMEHDGAVSNRSKVIVITAYQDKFLEAHEKGCDDYMCKPISFEELIGKIKEVDND